VTKVAEDKNGFEARGIPPVYQAARDTLYTEESKD
jgi:hypothetical protein